MRLGWKSTGLPRLDSREKCFSFKQIHRDPKITLLSFNLRHNFSSDLSYQKFPLKSFCQIFQPTSEALRPSCSWCERSLKRFVLLSSLWKIAFVYYFEVSVKISSLFLPSEVIVVHHSFQLEQARAGTLELATKRLCLKSQWSLAQARLE